MSSEMPVRPDLEGMAAAAERDTVPPKVCECSCCAFVRMDVQNPDRTFRPGPDFRCINCKREQKGYSPILALIAYTRALEEAARPFAEASSIKRIYADSVSQASRDTIEHDDYHCPARFTNRQVRRLAALLPLAEQEGR